MFLYPGASLSSPSLPLYLLSLFSFGSEQPVRSRASSAEDCQQGGTARRQAPPSREQRGGEERHGGRCGGGRRNFPWVLAPVVVGGEL